MRAIGAKRREGGSDGDFAIAGMPKNGREPFSWPADRSWLPAKDAVEHSLSILHNDRTRSTGDKFYLVRSILE